MKLTAICEFCLKNNEDPIMEVNFKDQKIYYICPFCKKHNEIILKIENKPYPKPRRLFR